MRALVGLDKELDKGLKVMVLIDCPTCGQQLSPHVGMPESPPWVCHVCRHMYWVCELHGDARAKFRPAFRDFGYGAHNDKLKMDREIEYRDAIKRGCSVREDQLGMLSSDELVALGKMKGRLDSGLKDKVDLMVKGKRTVKKVNGKGSKG